MTHTRGLKDGEASMKQISYENYFWQNELVRLRPWEFDDWEDSYASLFDSEGRFLLQEEVELPPRIATWQEKSKKWAESGADAGRTMFAIDALEGKTVGAPNLNSVDERNGTFGIGIQILTGERGKGYGTAAMQILLKYAFLERRLNKFNSGCVEGNSASAKMHEKLGCEREGVRKQMYYSKGRYFDWWLYGLAKENYLKRLSKS
jgi:RimJ/RimL family protein N-acetyltransferase